MTDKDKDYLNDAAMTAGPGAGASVSESGEQVRIGGAAVKGLFSSRGGLTAPANRKRFVLLLVSVGLLVLAIIYTFLSATPAVKGGAGKVERMTVGDRSSLDLDDGGARKQAEIQRYNDEELPRRQEKNPFAHPIIMDASEDPAELVLEEPAPAPAPVVVQEQPAPERPAPQPGMNEERANVALDLLSRLAEQESTVPSAMSVSWNYRTKRQDSAPGAAQAVADTADEPAGAPVCTAKNVRAGSVLFATTDLALNSDIGGEVSVTVRSGELRNYKLLGAFELKEKWLRITLNRLVAPEGVVPVQAIALDMDTTLNAVSGNVDRHLVYRYGWWGVGTLLTALGKAAELAADKQVYHVDGMVVENVSTTTSQEMRMALGELGQGLGDLAKERLNRPITVSMNPGEQIGVFVLDDICVQ